jgi:hypothetical protein
MALTLAIWQRLEDKHFRLFVKMLGAPQIEICPIVYYSIRWRRQYLSKRTSDGVF